MKSWARPGFVSALQRLDLLLHREILRLRASYQLSLDEFRGLYISDRQVDELIRHHGGLGQIDVSRLTVAAEQRFPQVGEDLAGDSRWQALCEIYDLSRFEQDVLILAFAPELHSKYPVLYAYLNNDVTRKFPTVELALNLFCEPGESSRREVFSSQGSLVRKGLITAVADQADISGLQSGFAMAPPVREFLLNHQAMDQRLAQSCRLQRGEFRPWSRWPFSGDTLEQFRVFAGILQRADRCPLYVIESPAGSGVEELAENALAGAGFACCRVELKALFSHGDNSVEAVRNLCQMARLEHAGLVISDLPEILEQPQGDRSLLNRLLRQLNDEGTPCFIPVHPGTRWWMHLEGLHHLTGRVGLPTIDERQQYWQHHLDAAGIAVAAEDVAIAADYFQLGYDQVRNAVGDLAFRHQLAGDCDTLSREQLFAAARRQSHGDMGELAERVSKRHELSDLVLPGAVLIRIRELVSAIRSRRMVFEHWDLQRRMGGASGIVALFSGASGTGKTMSASVIANEIGLDLYRIELSGIVSKYIGETEKNLDRIFAAARKANCILFFDEADALFGKRSEVKDAHDRYANIEVAYLLQKIENHDGIVILTTNLAKSIDPAFARRMQFIIEFPRPDVALREQLWRGMFGDAVPLADDVDFNFLARQLDNTGGEIRNMVLDAALMAAAGERRIIDMSLLVRAAARQMMKQGKVPSAVEFKHYFSLVDNRSA